MTSAEFGKLLSKTYPALCDFHAIGEHVNVLINGYLVSDFIDEHDIKPVKYSHVSYDDVWEYIVANEDKHDWWML